MKVKTSELSGAQLDWAVAKCEGVDKQDYYETHNDVYMPSTDWAQGGPIIERERIILITPRCDGWWTARFTFDEPDFDGIASVEIDGPTPLVAAMRAYVAGKLGAEVEEGK